MKYPRQLTEEMSRTPADLDAYRDRIHAAAQRLGFAMPDPAEFIDTVEGFGFFLKECGIRHFSATEATRPANAAKAKSVGYTVLLPPDFTWPWCALVLKLADGARTMLGEPVRLRNLWRPQSYNDLVAESEVDSDHPNACAADLDFASIASRRKAEGYFRGVHAAMPELEISLGLGPRTVHVGVLSPKGTRTWWYEGYSETQVALQKRA